MTRVASTRRQLLALVRATPFRPFAINLENGDRMVIEHPENISFDVTEDGRQDYTIVTNKLLFLGNLSAVSSLAVVDKEPLPQDVANGRG